MTSTRQIGWAAALAATLLVGACGGDDDEPTPVVTPVVTTLEVPDSAGANSAAFVGYIQALGANDEAGEPLSVKAGFAVPPDDDTEPSPLS